MVAPEVWATAPHRVPQARQVGLSKGWSLEIWKTRECITLTTFWITICDFRHHSLLMVLLQWGWNSRDPNLNYTDETDDYGRLPG